MSIRLTFGPDDRPENPQFALIPEPFDQTQTTTDLPLGFEPVM
jgi:hypothetical protein